MCWLRFVLCNRWFPSSRPSIPNFPFSPIGNHHALFEGPERVENIRTFQFLDSQTLFTHSSLRLVCYAILKCLVSSENTVSTLTDRPDGSVTCWVFSRCVVLWKGSRLTGRRHGPVSITTNLLRNTSRTETRYSSLPPRRESAPDDVKVTGDTQAAELYLFFGIEARSFKCHDATQPSSDLRIKRVLNTMRTV